MYVLIDFSQIVKADAISYYSHTKQQITMDLLRHIVLQNIIYYKKKFKVSNENFYICFDGRNYWRKDVFPYYKQNRKKMIESDVGFDWNEFYKYFNEMKDELKSDLPFKTLEVNNCEADDIIAVVSEILCSTNDQIIIVSSDKDFIQIQKYICPEIKQWSPFHKKYLTSETNDYNLFEHIVRGDSPDGIPNILSDEDVFITSKRSKAIRTETLKQWEKTGNITEPNLFCSNDEMLQKFQRNRTLIDLRMIPEKNKNDIANAFGSCECTKVDIFKYLVKHKLRKIMESGGL